MASLSDHDTRPPLGHQEVLTPEEEYARVIERLKRQLANRTRVLDGVRKAYWKDVVHVREFLRSHVDSVPEVRWTDQEWVRGAGQGCHLRIPSDSFASH